jgi:hypothetical protein
MVFKERWRPPLGASVALKISKSELEARKLQPSQIGRGLFLQKNLDRTAPSLFLNPSKKIL